MTAPAQGFLRLAPRNFGRRRVLAGAIGGASLVALAACGGVATSQVSTSETQQVFLTVLPGMKLGPDGKLHDAFSPADFTVTQGRPVSVTVYNYDNMPHSVTAPSLGLNATIVASTKKGVPAVTTFTFTAAKAGKFLWNCDLPCDDDANGWAMSHPGYMSGYITVTPV